MASNHRDSIVVVEAELTEVEHHPDEQFIMRLHAPEIARRAEPGSFVHLTCSDALPMRRPISLQRVNTQTGTIEILFKTHGVGLSALAAQPAGTSLSVMGPIGKPFTPSPERPIALLVGGGVGIPPMIYLAEFFANDRTADWQPMVFMGSEIAFPFATCPADDSLAHMPPDATHTLASMQAIGIPGRLASKAGIAGAHDGFVTDLAHQWLEQQDDAVKARCEIFACGPTPMLAATARVAEKHGVACQVSLEEYMACAVGGCAGCVVAVHEPDGVAMRRVCVDGPVFEAAKVFPPETN
ncbi:MAG: dihydroorotate dehydrogenase electron transfer subunit [Pseudomonadota bacterium]